MTSPSRATPTLPLPPRSVEGRNSMGQRGDMTNPPRERR